MKKNIFLSLLFGFSLYLVLTSFFAVFGNTGQASFQMVAYDIGKFFGLVGFFMLSLLIISGDWARLLDRVIGLDKIIKFQRKFAVFVFFLVISHPIFFIISNTSFARYLLIQTASSAILYGTITLYLFILVSMASKFYKKISYKAWQVIHIGLYVMFFLGLKHAFDAGSETNLLVIKIPFYIMIILLVTGALYRTVYKIRNLFTKYIIKEIRWENENIYTVVVRHNEDFNFKAGQFAFLRINGKKLFTRHPFTISNSPGSKNMEFSVKLEGRFTRTLAKLKPGYEIKIEGPFGLFTIPDDEKNIVFIAGGIGITPMRSILSDAGDHSRFSLIYCARTESDLVFRKELESYKYLEKTYVLSREKKKGPWINGRLSRDILKKHIKKDAMYYICGPEGLKDATVKNLIELGISRKNIIIEDFFW
ncbi:MAG: ferric reductase-like transmembrane domain-containing protein [Candidatus Woesearchaeota archaeon]